VSQQRAKEIAGGERFAFGDNWRRFLEGLIEGQIREAQRSLAQMLATPSLEGLRFADVGCGSGLFSLVARRMGAVVESFDYDPASVGCTLELKRHLFDGDERWTIREGWALDQGGLGSLGEFDIVCSWGPSTTPEPCGAPSKMCGAWSSPAADSTWPFIMTQTPQGESGRRSRDSTTISLPPFVPWSSDRPS
jgi:hypothetical protein